MFIGVGLGLIGALLYRVRGGLLDAYIWNSTQLARLIWAGPTAILVWYGTTPYASTSEIPYANLVLLVLSFFGSCAFFGSGAHSVMDKALWDEQWLKGNKPDDVENYTSWWLPDLFGGKPNIHWLEEDLIRYHMFGKSTEGIVRNALAIFPIIIINPFVALIFIGSGILWGPLFNVAWKMNSKELSGWNIGELFCGFISWFVLGFFLYGHGT